MAPKLVSKGIKSLESFVPTDEEVDASKQALKAMDKSEEKRAMSNLAYFLKKNGPQDEAKNVRGDLRRQWLIKYQAMKSREKAASTTSTQTRQLSSARHDHEDLHWWGKFQLQKEIGERKAMTWVESKKMLERPDQITQQHGEWLTEYKVFFSGGSINENDTMNHEVQTTKEEADVDAALSAIESTGSCMAGSEPPAEVVIKQEPNAGPLPSDDALFEDKVAHDPKGTLRRIQAQLTDTKSLRARTTGVKYSDDLVKDMDKLVPLLRKVEKGVEAIVVNPDKKPIEDAFKKLCKNIQMCDARFNEIVDWACRFGIKTDKKRRRTAN